MSHRTGTAARSLLVLLLLVLSGPAATDLRAQSDEPPDRRVPLAPVSADEWVAPLWAGDIAFAAGNALLAGITAGVTRRLRGGDFSDAFVSGAAGGAIAYTGRRVASGRFDGAGMLGRQVSAVGASMARNAGDGRPSLERLMFPVGPIHLYVDRSGGLLIQPRLHVVGAAQATRLALTDETELDWAGTLSAGAFVFRAPGREILIDDLRARGLALNGSIVLGEAGEMAPAELFAHERVHILQLDMAFLIWSEPAERWLMGQNRYTARIDRYLDFGVLVPMLGFGALSLTGVDFQDWPHEIEARFVAER